MARSWTGEYVPAVALWYAYGIAFVLGQIRTRSTGFVVASAAVLITLLPLGPMYRLHPYEMTYFNRLTGGLAGAVGRYETEYWITSYREAIEWINADAAGRVVNVLVAGPRHARRAPPVRCR